MKKTLLFSVFCCLWLLHDAIGQQTVKGQILSAEESYGLPGVNIVIKGTQQGTTTDVNGYYSIKVPDEETVLVFTFLGMKTKEVLVGTQAVLDIQMEPDITQLTEVAVIGYGSMERREITGSVTSVKPDEIKNLPVPGIDAALQGKAAGVQVVQSSGTPGSGISVRVRGMTSINASNQPLYVVDGVPINSGDYSAVGVGGQGLNAMAEINPSDIESIEVLKDAASASIYGSRGANGVVIITTKKGTRNTKTQLNFNTYFGVQQRQKKIDVLNGRQYREYLSEALANVDPTAGPSDYYIYDNVGDPYDLLMDNTDWQDQIFQQAPVMNYELSASGGDELTAFYLSATYFNQEGIIKGSGYDRFSTRFNFDHKASKRLTLGANIGLSRSLNDRIQNDNNIYGALSTALLHRPDRPVYNEDGSFFQDEYSSIENPLAASTLYENDAVTSRMIGTVYGHVDIMRGLSFKSSWSVDYLTLKEKVYEPVTLRSAVASNGQASSVHSQDVNWISEQTLNYNVQLGRHKLQALAGASFQESAFETVFGSGSNFPSSKLKNVSSAAVLNSSSSGTAWGLTSFFTRLTYDYEDRYLATASFRADGSSRFSKGNKYGYFPSVSLGWRLSEEAFLSDFSLLEDLKIRTSFGVTGNQQISNFAPFALIGSGANYDENGGLAPSQLENENLQWETTTQWNAGIDFAIWKGRVGGTVDYYYKDTKDLLLSVPIPATSGFRSQLRNVGHIRNTGIEIALNAVLIEGDFRWTTSMNASFNRNRVLALHNGEPINTGFASRIEEGFPLGSFYGWEWLGVDPLTGKGMFADLDNDNNEAQGILLDDDDRKVLGNALPVSTGGLTNTLSWKGIELNVFMQYSYGNKVYNMNREFSEGMHSFFNQTTRVLDRWQQVGDQTDVPVAEYGDPNMNSRNSSRFLEDGSFLRLKTVTLSYQLPVAMVNRAGLRSLRLYIQGQNAYTFTNYSGLDPEVSAFDTSNTAFGTDFLTYPQAKTFMIGLNAGF